MNNNPDVIKQGWVFKKSKHLKKYHRRYMQLKGSKLICYKTAQFPQSKPTEQFNLSRHHYTVNIHETVNVKFYLIYIDNEPQFNSTFTDNSTNTISRTFKAESNAERDDWVQQIQKVCKQISNDRSVSVSQVSNPLSLIDPNALIQNLLHTGKLLRAKASAHPHFENIFDKHGALMCCCVTLNSCVIPYSKFESTHFLYIKYKKIQPKNKHKLSFSPSDFETQTCFVYYILRMTQDKFFKIEKFIKQNNRNNKLFAEASSHKPLPDTIRKRGDLHAQYSFEDALVTKPTLPSGPGFLKKSMTKEDARNRSEYLHRVFNCVDLLLTEELYQFLDITDGQMIKLFQTLAWTKLKTLKSVGDTYAECTRDPTKLRKKIETKFHTVWMVKRPLSNRGAALIGCDHWALKLEGDTELMTIGFFSFNAQHGIINTKVVLNTPLNRRLFWYYWARDNADQIESQHFNSRWSVLDKLYVGNISCALIGALVEEWLSYNNHHIYDLKHNNCQHFVRDIIAGLNERMAIRLSAAFDVRVFKSLMPAGILVEGIGAEAKCKKEHERLWPIILNFQNQMSLAKAQNDMTEQQKLENAFDVCANHFRQLGVRFSLSNSSCDELCVEDVQAQVIEEEEKQPIIVPQPSLTVCENEITTNSNVALSNQFRHNLGTEIKKSTFDFDMSSCNSLSPETDLEQKNEETMVLQMQNTFENTIKQALSDNLIGNAIVLTEQLLNVSNLWQDTIYNQNIMATYPLRARSDQNSAAMSTQSETSEDSKKDSNEDESNGDKFNNNRQNNNQNNGNAPNKRHCRSDEYDCNVSWHKSLIIQLKDQITMLQSLENHTEELEDNKDNIEYEILKCDSVSIQPSKKLIKTISGIIRERFSDMFVYLNKYSLIHQSDAIMECKTDQGMIQIIDYNMHCKETQQKLYAICEKNVCKNDKIVWKTNDALYTAMDIAQTYQICADNLPNVSMNVNISEIQRLKTEIRNLLKKEITNIKHRNGIFDVQNRQIKWTNRDKIPIFDKIKKQTKAEISLHLTKEEFVIRLREFGNKNVNNLCLVPIIKFSNRNKYCIEMVWIVSVSTNSIKANVGISLQIKQSKKYGQILMPTGIYLDLNDAHSLVPYTHECTCLDTFECEIDTLRIGPNQDIRTQQSKMQQRLNEYERKCREYTEVRRKDTMIITQNKREYKKLQNSLKEIEQFLHSLLNQQNQINLLNQQIIVGRLEQYQSQIQTNDENLSAQINNLNGDNQ